MNSIAFGSGFVTESCLVKERKWGGNRKFCFQSSVASTSQKNARIGVLGASGYTGLEGVSCHINKRGCIPSFRSGLVILNTRPSFSCMVSMTNGQSGDHGKLNVDHIMYKTRKLWNELPQPVKDFPWSRVLENFIQVILNVAAAVIKYLSAPLFAVSSLSEMSYCAHERKLFLAPIPLIFGFVAAGIYKAKTSESSSLAKDVETPWHWIPTAILFALIKLPGPYYPYWARIFIPHFANGGLLRVVWMMFLWYRRPKDGANANMQQGVESLEQK